ncbi:phosphotransferase [Myceligenerans salitolerans]|uniref:phosphotransferase n=1 Tax=Myceligenerans salitolerans TaxID=1230528 RepID=UPI003557626B
MPTASRPPSLSGPTGTSPGRRDSGRTRDGHGAGPVPRLRSLFAAHVPALDQVTTPVLVHFDLWPGNVLVDDGRLSGTSCPPDSPRFHPPDRRGGKRLVALPWLWEGAAVPAGRSACEAGRAEGSRMRTFPVVAHLR